MRIKFSVPRHARKKKILKRASGYYGDKSRRLRMATQQLGKSGVHAYVDRKDKKPLTARRGSFVLTRLYGKKVCLTLNSLAA